MVHIENEIIERIKSEIQLTDDEYADIVSGLPNRTFTNFQSALDVLKQECAMYEKLGADFKKEARESKSLYDRGVKLGKSLLRYNNTDRYGSEVKKVRRVIQAKVMMPDQLELANEKFEDYTFFEGIFTTAEMYIIPTELLGIKVIDETTGLQLSRHEWLKVATTISCCTEEGMKILRGNNTDIPLPSEAKYGTIRLIDSKHVAVLANNEDNPIVRKMRTDKNWRYVFCDGYSC